jgi:hypothetical protein
MAEKIDWDVVIVGAGMRSHPGSRLTSHNVTSLTSGSRHQWDQFRIQVRLPEYMG